MPLEGQGLETEPPTSFQTSTFTVGPSSFQSQIKHQNKAPRPILPFNLQSPQATQEEADCDIIFVIYIMLVSSDQTQWKMRRKLTI